MGRGNPQNRALFALLRDQLVILQHVGCGAIAYVDDIVRTISGRFMGTIGERTQLALGKVREWAFSRAFGINRAIKYRILPDKV